ncbi:unnamed protein product [Rotaria sordida]|uniref:B30.2/SPRY domain-containing protein n=1 Tax=Rotaria sordida TaxID=392033 RepID=A0A815IHT4_9BILA|nr:unnamed protein product [Rotaria sordida]CAF1365593.1 unnamed protein product [Rotaria sordida]
MKHRNVNNGGSNRSTIQSLSTSILPPLCWSSTSLMCHLKSEHYLKTKNCLHSHWKWSQTNKIHSTTILLDNNKQILFHPRTSSSTQVILADRPLPLNGKHYWEIYMPAVYGTSIMFGIATNEQQMFSSTFTNLIGIDQHGWALSHHGLLWHNGISYSYLSQSMELLRPILIGLEFDADARTLSYIINNQSMGIAFRCIPKNVLIYPAVSSTSAQSTMILKHCCKICSSLREICLKLIKSSKLKENINNQLLPRHLIEQLINQQKTSHFILTTKNEKYQMFGAKKRRTIAPIKERDPDTLLREHIVKNTDASHVLVSEYDVLDKQKPVSFWMRDLNIPQWLLLVFVSLTIIVFTAFALFTAIVTLKKEMDGGPCKSNTDCRRDLSLICNNYRCGCAYSHFWSNSYSICERRRMVNRTCVNDSMCDAFASLQCQNVPLTNGAIESQCQCKTSMSWNGYICVYQSLYNTSCLLDANCDTSRYLFCNLTIQLCQCNSSMFWNGDSKSGTCEYKRTVNRYCYPYDNNWCDDTGPLGQRLVCTRYTNPYGSEYGVCQCSTHEFYNGSASLGNGICVPHHLYNESCTSTSQCDYRINLACLSNLCLCPSGTNYDSSINSNGVMGYCKSAAGYMENCTASLVCSSSQNLFCNLSYYGGANTSGICQCNSSWSYWDGTTCTTKLSIGGECSSNIHCIEAHGLFCSNYTQSIGTCDCDKDHFWNNTCISKQWYNTTCPSSYVCDDNRGLQCQGLGGSMFQKCDCYNTTYIWDSLYVTNRSYTCIPKLTNGQSPCFGDLECEDFNYLKCNNGTCGCYYTDYWDGSRCQPKRNYADPCSNTYQCRDFSPVNLICRYGTTSPVALQCLCNTTSYWEECVQACLISKKYHESCTLVSNCTTNECDKTANLQCMNDSISSLTGSGWCNCTQLQWWNGSYCRNKGTPSWGVNASNVCNATYQCADYNLVSCPLSTTCECATTKYWDGTTCKDRVLYGESCTSWPTYPFCHIFSNIFIYINEDMIMNENNILKWLKEFKFNWLPQHISNDTHLLQLITNQINEFEQLLIQNNQVENDSSIENNYQCTNSSDIRQFDLSTQQQQQQQSENFLCISSDKHDVDNKKQENYSRPAIRLKRISLAEAERFLPLSWKTSTKSKPGRKKRKIIFSKFIFNGKKAKKDAQTNKTFVSTSTPDETINNSKIKQKTIRSKTIVEHPSTSSIASTQSVNNNNNNNNNKKKKRKLRAMDGEDDDLCTLGNLSQTDVINGGDTECEQVSRYIGQNGILSQTRKINETTINIENDKTIKQSKKSKKKKKLTKKSSNHSNDHSVNTKSNESSPCEILTFIEDIGQIHHEEILQDITENDQQSLFDSLNITPDRTYETNSTLNINSFINYTDCIEDISNDAVDLPSTTLSSNSLSHVTLTT